MQREHFPKTHVLTDGRQIVIANELCNCTHFRTQHDGDWGSGCCNHSGCSCGQFTWKCLVLGGLSEPTDKWVASIGPCCAENALEEIQRELEEKEREIGYLEDERTKLEKDLSRAQEECKNNFLKEARLEQELKFVISKYTEAEAKLMKFMQPYRRIVLARGRAILIVDDP